MFKTTIALAAIAAMASAETPRERLEVMFVEHMQKYSLDFQHGKEFVERLEIFIQEVESIEKHNADSSKTYTRGLNQFSHLTESEWKDAVRLGSTRPPNLRRNPLGAIHGEPLEDPPASVDWVAQGAVTPVKNQGQCGSCWSFSTTGSLEGAYFLKNGNLKSFSEQELVSCDTTDNGCNGGWMDDAFAWIKQNGGIQTESDYPYTSGAGVSGSCKGTGNSVAGSAPSSYTDVQAGSASALMSAVAQQPVSVAIQADQLAFKSYSGGVLTGTCGTSLDHGVLAVGYGTLNGVDYWKVKNSWGPTWGEDGYILIERNANDKCGILLAASYPVM
jgi:C1A family cysteine protease